MSTDIAEEKATVKDPTKERVEKELDELNERIVKLTCFLFSRMILDMKLSQAMIFEMRDQLTAMQNYAQRLQRRLQIWGKTDEDLEKEFKIWPIG